MPYEEPIEPEITFLKKCSKCNLYKVREVDFYKSNRSFDGRVSQCKQCDDTKNRKWRDDNSDRFKQLVDNRYQENKDVISAKFRERYANDEEYRKDRLVQFYIR